MDKETVKECIKILQEDIKKNTAIVQRPIKVEALLFKLIRNQFDSDMFSEKEIDRMAITTMENLIENSDYEEAKRLNNRMQILAHTKK